MKRLIENLLSRRSLSFILSTLCLASTMLTAGCRFERELFGSAASGVKSSSSAGNAGEAIRSNADSSAVSADATDLLSSFVKEESSGNEVSSDISRAPEASSDGDASEAPANDKVYLSPPASASEPEQSSSAADYIRLLTNSSLLSLGFRQPRDALALILSSPLEVQVSRVATLDSVSISDISNCTYLVVPIYNNSTVELFVPNRSGSSADGEDGMELIYRRESTPSGYGLRITANSRDETAAFRLVIHSGSFAISFDVICSRTVLDGGGYLLNNGNLKKLDYVGDAIDAVERSDALSMVVNELTRELNVTYKWENTSHTSVHLSVEQNDGPISGEYYLSSSELRDGKGCCYYMISLGRRIYNDNGAATGEDIVNRYLVTVPGGQIVPMYGENGAINREYNDIII